MEHHVLLSVFTEYYASVRTLSATVNCCPTYARISLRGEGSCHSDTISLQVARSAYISRDAVCPINNVSNVATRCYHQTTLARAVR